jgi:hypothetical protein
MGTNIKLGDSSVQRAIEEYVLGIISEIGIGPILPNAEYSTDRIAVDNYNFELDFHIKKKVIGEIYACKYKLLSAQTKKVQGDLLKMITVEKSWGQENLTKIFIMALSVDDKDLPENLKSPQGKFIRAKDPEHYINTLGENSWIWKTINDFHFEIFYIILPDELSKSLIEQRAKQLKAIKI